MKCCKLTWLGVALLVAVGLLLAVGPVIGKQDDSVASDPMMEAWMKAGEPGPHHQYLAKLEGTWKAEVSFWMYPGGEAHTHVGTMKNTMMWDRYLVSDYEGEMDGIPFQGRATWGYNNISKRFESNWIDSMSTMIANGVGTCNEDGTVFNTKMTMYDPMTGDKKTTRDVFTIHGPDKHTMETFDKGPDGKEFKSMQIVYTR